MAADHRPNRFARIVIAATASLAIVAGLGMGAFAARWYSLRNVSVVDNFNGAHGGQNKDRIPAGACTQPCNILLLGSDSRSGLSQSQQEQNGTNSDIGGTTRADTIMLVHLDPDTSKTVVLSFPRDLWVNIPGHGTDKINSAFEGGVHGDGPQVVSSTITRLSGLRINHWMY